MKEPIGAGLQGERIKEQKRQQIQEEIQLLNDKIAILEHGEVQEAVAGSPVAAAARLGARAVRVLLDAAKKALRSDEFEVAAKYLSQGFKKLGQSFGTISVGVVSGVLANRVDDAIKDLPEIFRSEATSGAEEAKSVMNEIQTPIDARRVRDGETFDQWFERQRSYQP